jgi:hypothetical protein
MCLYEPPLFLGEPDLSAAVICALPLAMSATRWSELLSAFVGLSVAFVAAHFFIVAMSDHPPTWFYWHGALLTVIPTSFVTIAFNLTVVFAFARFVSGLWRREYRRAGRYLLLALVLVGTVVGLFLYEYFSRFGFKAAAASAFVMNQTVPAYSSNGVGVMFGCRLPPFGEGITGYSMLAALVIFEILVAVAIAGALKGWKR